MSEHPILWDVVEEHLDEAEFLWGLCNALLDDPEYSAPELHEGPSFRLSAHVAALSVADPIVIDELLLPALDDPARAPAAALAWLARPEPDAASSLLRATVARDEDIVRGVAAAFGWSMRPSLDAAVRGLLRSSSGELDVLLLQICAARALDAGTAFDRALASSDRAAQGAAVLASRWGDRRKLLPFVEHYIEDAEFGLAAIDTALGWGSQLAWQALSKRAQTGDANALARFAMFTGEATVRQLVALTQYDERRHAALWALGWAGWPEAARACLSWMQHDDATVAALAGEAFAWITGLPVTEPYFSASLASEDDEDADEELPPLEEDLETDLTLRPEDALPAPDASAIERWWEAEASRFSNRTRMMLGRPIGSDAVVWGLREGAVMRRRHLLGVSLGVHSRGQVWIPTRVSPGLSQACLARAEIDPHLLFQRGLG